MSTKYKIKDSTVPHFVTAATVGWVDVFVRNVYKDIFVDSLKFCQINWGLIVHSWVLMPSHFHMVVSSREKSLGGIMRDFKAYTSKTIRSELEQNFNESRRDWMIPFFRAAGLKNSNNNDWQFWQHENHPMELYSKNFYDQKVGYIHLNPVRAGFVEKPEHWIYSSARDFSRVNGLIELSPYPYYT